MKEWDRSKHGEGTKVVHKWAGSQTAKTGVSLSVDYSSTSLGTIVVRFDDGPPPLEESTLQLNEVWALNVRIL